MGWDQLDGMLDHAPGSYSVCLQRPGEEPLYTYEADVVRRAASLIKVPIAMALVQSNRRRMRGSGGVDLDAVVTLCEEDRARGDGAWEGSLDVAPAGTQRSRWQLIDHALRESDNTAANLLIAAIGMDQVNRFLRAEPLCLHATLLQRRFIDFAAAAAGRENWTTAREMCAIFDTLYAASDLYAPLLDAMRHSPSVDAMVAGVPPGIVVAHKVGGLPGVEHDAGIVYAPAGPYIAAFLASDLPDEQTGRSIIAAASRFVFKQMSADRG